MIKIQDLQFQGIIRSKISRKIRELKHYFISVFGL
jgi:hypothetical protein